MIPRESILACNNVSLQNGTDLNYNHYFCLMQRISSLFKVSLNLSLFMEIVHGAATFPDTEPSEEDCLEVEVTKDADDMDLLSEDENED